MYTLKGMTKRRAVVLLENIFADLHDEIGPDTQDVGVNARWWIAHIATPFGTIGSPPVAVFLDVGRIEEFRVTQSA